MRGCTSRRALASSRRAARATPQRSKADPDEAFIQRTWLPKRVCRSRFERAALPLLAMDLVGSLSNRLTSDLLHFLTQENWSKALQRRRLEDGPAPDGRRAFGSLRDAIVAVVAA